MKLLLIFFILGINWVSATPACQARYHALSIPYQEVKSQEEFYYCFGFHHGSDRAWQMDYFRRVALGTNAEVLGYEHLKSDLMMRLLDLPRLAAKLWNDFPPDAKKMLQLYADGANAGFAKGGDSEEFKQLGYSPDKWLPVHSLMVLLLQSFDQTRKTFFQEYQEEQYQENWGNEAAELFSTEGLPWENTILKAGEYPLRVKPATTDKAVSAPIPGRLWAHFPTIFGEESGSNNWVISKHKSKSGHAILANDPHLDLKTPLFWYWIHLKSPATQVIGASLPGVPIIASGTNMKVAWGLTNAYINTADAVLLDSVNETLESIRPTVWFKVWFLKIPFFFKSFERSREGHPVLPLELNNPKKILLRWSGFGLKASDILPMFHIADAQDVAGMDKVLSQVGLPAWNFVFADTQGEIGFRAIGKAYRHTEKLPFGMPEMSYQDFSKEDFLSADEMPQLLRPERNYVYSANNRHWPLDAAFYGGRGYSHSFRAWRIDEMLQGQQDVASFQEIQCDREAIDARFFVPRIVQHIESPELEQWNFKTNDTNQALPLYRRLMDIMMEKWKVNENALYRLLNQLSSEQHKELRDMYQLAHAEVAGRDWGEIHKVGFFHLSRNGEWIFSPEISGVGDNQTVDPGTAKWNPERRIYEQNAGASMRMIIEMRDKPVLYLNLPGLNREYTDIRYRYQKEKEGEEAHNPWEKWRSCHYTRFEL